MRYLAHTPEDIESMLGTIGKPSIESLFNSIDPASRLQRSLNLPHALAEPELKRELKNREAMLQRASFMGAGVTAHFVPELVSQMLLRGEWYTAYTPYQPEVSQGTLQAIFEFQTITANLFGCDIANASMYDGATALAEALLMTTRLKKTSKKVLLARNMHPEYKQVCDTYLHAAGIEIEEIKIRNGSGCVDIDHLKAVLTRNESGCVSALAFQMPNFFGQLEDQKELIELAHQHGLLAVAANTDPLAFGVIRSPGTLGADVVVGEGLGLCGHLSLGGPGVGLFATSAQFVRQMPGRVCGATVDKNGKPGFVLTLAAREQHIRREKATSNICTNHNLMALAFTITMSLYGKSGFLQLAKRNLQKTIYFRKEATRCGLPIAFPGPHFNETVIKFPSEVLLQQKIKTAAGNGVWAGVPLSKWFKEFEGHLLVATTELHTKEDMALLLEFLR